MFRGLIASLLAFALFVSVLGCGGGDSDKQPKTENPNPNLKPATPAGPGVKDKGTNSKASGV